jgi:DNA (cytosine-5)-methyltransferase 1
MSKPFELLDLGCGAGGATRGYQMAGYRVTGVDIHPQPNYVGDEFHQADALTFAAEHGHRFDAIHASMPCQRFSGMSRCRPEVADRYPGKRWAALAG